MNYEHQHLIVEREGSLFEGFRLRVADGPHAGNDFEAVLTALKAEGWQPVGDLPHRLGVVGERKRVILVREQQKPAQPPSSARELAAAIEERAEHREQEARELARAVRKALAQGAESSREPTRDPVVLALRNARNMLR